MNNSSKLMPYHWMVKFTPQEAWIKGKGALLWLAFFFSEIGAGLYFVSLFLDLRLGLVTGWLMALVLGGGLHLLYLGKPFRAALMFLRPGKSELSRGLWVMLIFGALGFFQVSPVVITGLPWSGTSLSLKAVMAVICILIVTHGFLTMSVVRSLPLWNSSVMAPLSVVSAIWVGSQVAVVLSGFFGRDMAAPEIWARWSLFFFMGFLGVFLLGAMQSSPNAKASVRRLLVGEGAMSFYLGVVGAGIVVPAIITLTIWGGDINNVNGGVLLFRCICVTIGDLATRYGIMRSGYYTPLI